jgi:hypothetical protein
MASKIPYQNKTASALPPGKSFFSFADRSLGHQEGNLTNDRTKISSAENKLFFKPAPASTIVQRKCSVCGEEKKLQRKEATTEGIAASEKTRGYTTGNNIVFNASQFIRDANEDKKLSMPRLMPVSIQSTSFKKNIQRLSALTHTGFENTENTGYHPYTRAPYTAIAGNEYRVFTDRGNMVGAWVAYTGLPEQQNSWCHGFSLGTYDRWGYSVFSGPNDVGRVLIDEYSLVTPALARAGDIIAWRGGRDFSHTAILRSIALVRGSVDLTRSLMDSKNGTEPIARNVSISSVTDYGNTIEFYRKT